MLLSLTVTEHVCTLFPLNMALSFDTALVSFVNWLSLPYGKQLKYWSICSFVIFGKKTLCSFCNCWLPDTGQPTGTGTLSNGGGWKSLFLSKAFNLSIRSVFLPPTLAPLFANSVLNLGTLHVKYECDAILVWRGQKPFPFLVCWTSFELEVWRDCISNNFSSLCLPSWYVSNRCRVWRNEKKVWRHNVYREYNFPNCSLL